MECNKKRRNLIDDTRILIIQSCRCCGHVDDIGPDCAVNRFTKNAQCPIRDILVYGDLRLGLSDSENDARERLDSFLACTITCGQLPYVYLFVLVVQYASVGLIPRICKL